MNNQTRNLKKNGGNNTFTAQMQTQWTSLEASTRNIFLNSSQLNAPMDIFIASPKTPNAPTTAQLQNVAPQPESTRSGKVKFFSLKQVNKKQAPKLSRNQAKSTNPADARK